MSKYRNRISEEDKIKAVELYKSGLSANKVGQEIGVSKTAIFKLLNKNNVCERNNYKKYSCNENFFREIDTEEKAYWLGFVSADGCINTRDKAVIITLKKSDRRHLEKFANSLSSDYPIRIGHSHAPENRNGKEFPNCRISISSGKLINDLSKLGIHPRKSNTIEICQEIPKKLQRHYWRGWVDGDGSVGINRIRLCGNLSVVTSFSEYVRKNIRTRAKIQTVKSIYEFEVSGKNLSRNLSKLLYENSSIYLDRKYEKAKLMWEV